MLFLQFPVQVQAKYVTSSSAGNLYFVLLIIVCMEKRIMKIENTVENRPCEIFAGSSGQALYHKYV